MRAALIPSPTRRDRNRARRESETGSDRLRRPPGRNADEEADPDHEPRRMAASPQRRDVPERGSGDDRPRELHSHNETDAADDIETGEVGDLRADLRADRTGTAEAQDDRQKQRPRSPSATRCDRRRRNPATYADGNRERIG